MYQRVAKYVLPVELLPERERQDLQLPLLLVKVLTDYAGSAVAGGALGATGTGLLILGGILGGPAGWLLAGGGLLGAIFGAGLCAAN